MAQTIVKPKKRYYYYYTRHNEPFVKLTNDYISCSDFINSNNVESRCQKCFNTCSSFTDVGRIVIIPEMEVDETNKIIDIFEICSHTLPRIKYLLTMIYKDYNVEKTAMAIRIHNNITTINDSPFLMDIFEGVDLILFQIMDELSLYRIYELIHNTNYRFRTIKQTSEMYGDFLLEDSCTKLSGKHIASYPFSRILMQNSHLKYFHIEKLIVHSNLDDFIQSSNKSLKYFSVGSLDSPQNVTANLTNKALEHWTNYISDLLYVNRFSLETVNIGIEKTSHLIWNDFCKRKVQWSALKEVIMSTIDKELLVMPSTYYTMPLLTKLTVRDLKTQQMAYPSMKAVCVTHGTMYYSDFEQLLFIINRNRVYIESVRTWLTIAKFYLKQYRIPRDVCLKIAHMVLRVDTSNMGFKDPIPSPEQLYQICEENDDDPCDMVMCTTPDKVRLWSDIKDQKLSLDRLNHTRTTLKSKMKPDKKRIQKKKDEIETIETRLNKKRENVDKIDKKISIADAGLEKKLKYLKTSK